MKKIVKRSLENGDVVLFRDHTYLAVEIDNGECTAECCLWDEGRQQCSALCTRFADEPPMVFKYLRPVELLRPTEAVVVSGVDYNLAIKMKRSKKIE